MSDYLDFDERIKRAIARYSDLPVHAQETLSQTTYTYSTLEVGRLVLRGRSPRPVYTTTVFGITVDLIAAAEEADPCAFADKCADALAFAQENGTCPYLNLPNRPDHEWVHIGQLEIRLTELEAEYGRRTWDEMQAEWALAHSADVTICGATLAACSWVQRALSPSSLQICVIDWANRQGWELCKDGTALSFRRKEA